MTGDLRKRFIIYQIVILLVYGYYLLITIPMLFSLLYYFFTKDSMPSILFWGQILLIIVSLLIIGVFILVAKALNDAIKKKIPNIGTHLIICFIHGLQTFSAGLQSVRINFDPRTIVDYIVFILLVLSCLNIKKANENDDDGDEWDDLRSNKNRRGYI